MYHYLGRPQTKDTVGAQASAIKIDMLGKPIGKQIQYIAAFAGRARISFREGDTVDVRPLVIAPEVLHKLDDALLLYYSGQGRDAGTVLTEQKGRVTAHASTLGEMVALVDVKETRCWAATCRSSGGPFTMAGS